MELVGRHILVIPSWYPSEYNPANGGFFRDQAMAVRAAGARVGVIYPELRSLRSLRPGSLRANHFQTVWSDDAGIPTLRFQGWNLPGRLQLEVWRRQALRLFDLYVERQGRPDLIHAHGAQTAGSAASLIRSERGMPYMLTEHSSAFVRGLFAEWRHPFLRAAFADATRIAAVSGALAHTIAPWAAGRSREIDVIPNLVDPAFFTLPTRPVPRSPYRVVCVALLNANKQVDVLLRAFSRAFTGASDVSLDVGGDGPERDRLEALARELGLEARVRFHGLLDRGGVRDLMQRSHLFVLPSAKETFGLVCAEAMCCGLRVLSTRSGGPEEIVTANVGTLVAPGDVDALAAALASERARGAPTADEAASIRADATARFGRDAVAATLLAKYEEIAAAPGVTAA